MRWSKFDRATLKSLPIYGYFFVGLCVYQMRNIVYIVIYHSRIVDDRLYFILKYKNLITFWYRLGYFKQRKIQSWKINISKGKWNSNLVIITNYLWFCKFQRWSVRHITLWWNWWLTLDGDYFWKWIKLKDGFEIWVAVMEYVCRKLVRYSRQS